MTARILLSRTRQQLFLKKIRPKEKGRGDGWALDNGAKVVAEMGQSGPYAGQSLCTPQVALTPWLTP